MIHLISMIFFRLAQANRPNSSSFSPSPKKKIAQSAWF
jgi:hypothetical protein